MKQFYETYKDDEIVTPPVTQISWTNHLLTMSGFKSYKERRFYMELGGCILGEYRLRYIDLFSILIGYKIAVKLKYDITLSVGGLLKNSVSV